MYPSHVYTPCKKILNIDSYTAKMLKLISVITKSELYFFYNKIDLSKVGNLFLITLT